MKRDELKQIIEIMEISSKCTTKWCANGIDLNLMDDDGGGGDGSGGGGDYNFDSIIHSIMHIIKEDRVTTALTTTTKTPNTCYTCIK